MLCSSTLLATLGSVELGPRHVVRLVIVLKLFGIKNDVAALKLLNPCPHRVQRYFINYELHMIGTLICVIVTKAFPSSSANFKQLILHTCSEVTKATVLCKGRWKMLVICWVFNNF
jgi:hypothetical protein